MTESGERAAAIVKAANKIYEAQCDRGRSYDNALNYEQICEVMAAVEQAAFEAGRGGWISVDVRLPSEREKVLIVHAAAPDNMHYPKVDVEMAFMADGEWYDAGDTRNMGAFNNETWSIEFWQPLPAPPDSGDKKEAERG